MTLSANLTTVKNALDGNAPMAMLVAIVRDSSNTSYYTSHDEDVTFDSQTYTAKGIAFHPPGADTSSSQHDAMLSVTNVDLTESAYVLAGKYIGQRVRVYLVNLNYLSSADDKVVWRGIVKSIDVDQDSVTFLVGIPNLNNATVPGGTLWRNQCSWVFKSLECAYAGGETTCDGRPETCLSYANQTRYGGAVNLPYFRP